MRITTLPAKSRVLLRMLERLYPILAPPPLNNPFLFVGIERSTSMGNVLVKAAVTDMALQWGLFLIAAYFRTEKFYDLAGSSTFILLAIQSLLSTGKLFPRQVLC